MGWSKQVKFFLQFHILQFQIPYLVLILHQLLVIPFIESYTYLPLLSKLNVDSSDAPTFSQDHQLCNRLAAAESETVSWWFHPSSQFSLWPSQAIDDHQFGLVLGPLVRREQNILDVLLQKDAFLIISHSPYCHLEPHLYEFHAPSWLTISRHSWCKRPQYWQASVNIFFVRQHPLAQRSADFVPLRHPNSITVIYPKGVDIVAANAEMGGAEMWKYFTYRDVVGSLRCLAHSRGQARTYIAVGNYWGCGDSHLLKISSSSSFRLVLRIVSQQLL